DLDSALRGVVASIIRRDDRTVGIRVRYPDEIRFDRTEVMRLPLLASGGVAAISAVADAQQIVTPSTLGRENLRPVAILTADHEDRDLGSVAGDVNRRLAGITLPEGSARELGGQYRAQQDTFRELASVLAFGLLAVL